MKSNKNTFASLLLLGAFFLIGSVQAQVNYKKTKIGDKVATLMLPESFQLMTEAEMKAELVMQNRPVAAYKDTQYPSILSISQSATQWNSTDLEMFKAFNKSTILGLHSEVRFLQEAIKEVNGEQVVIFEFVASVKPVRSSIVDKGDLKKYNYVQYSIKDGKLTGFNFSSPIGYRTHFQPIVQEIMNSAEVK